MLPDAKEAFVQFSEKIDPRDMEFTYLDDAQKPRSVPVDPEKNEEFVLSFDHGYPVERLAAGALFEVAGARDIAGPARDKNADDPDYPPPKYPTDWKYSDYVFVPGNPPAKANSYEIIPGTPTSKKPLCPPNVLPGGTLRHRVTDMLISNYPESYFATPVWAMNPQVNVGADQGAHVVRMFTGSDYLEDKDITLEINVHERLRTDYVPEFIFGSAIPDAARVGASPVDPDFGVPQGITGLWLPVFNSQAYGGRPPRENIYAFSNIVAEPYLPASAVSTVTKPEAAAGGNFIFKLEKNSSAYGYAGLSMLEYFLRLAPRKDNPASEYLDLGRLGKGTPWYRHVEPFKFEIHNVTRQRGGVTILNNVIKPSAGESVYVDYTLPRSGPVTVQVFTLDGNLVKVLARESKAAGEYRVGWDGRNNGGSEVARGMYFIRVVAPDVDEIRKVMVVR
jgi:hypothetical protein